MLKRNFKMKTFHKVQLIIILITIFIFCLLVKSAVCKGGKGGSGKGKIGRGKFRARGPVVYYNSHGYYGSGYNGGKMKPWQVVLIVFACIACIGILLYVACKYWYNHE